MILPGSSDLRSQRGQLIIEAVARLAFARLSLTVLSFQRAIGSGPLRRGVRQTVPDPYEIAGVAWAITAAAKRVPWRALCLEQAIAARAMLAHRSIPAVVHYGVARHSSVLAAHAWVRAAGCDVTGCENAAEFTEVARFEVSG